MADAPSITAPEAIDPVPAPEAPSRWSRLAVVAVVVAVVLVIDLATKQWAWDTLREGGPITVIDHVFYLKFGFNTGSAFSLLRDASWGRVFFIVVTMGALGYMGWLAAKMPTERVYGFVAVGLISSGAMGNLHDRIVRSMDVWINGQLVHKHGVIDFLQFYYNWPAGKYWPIFNVADSALVCGVGLLLLFMFRHGSEHESADAGA